MPSMVLRVPIMLGGALDEHMDGTEGAKDPDDA